jgi:hypothetical protein
MTRHPRRLFHLFFLLNVTGSPLTVAAFRAESFIYLLFSNEIKEERKNDDAASSSSEFWGLLLLLLVVVVAIS